MLTQDGYYRDGHALRFTLKHGDLGVEIVCPKGAGRNCTDADTAPDHCAVREELGYGGTMEFLEWNDREDDYPIDGKVPIEYRWQGGVVEAEFYWRPVG